MQTGVAIIGLGIMGTRMLDSLTLSETFWPVVAWDPSDAARSAAAASFPELMISVDAAAAIASPGVDVVYIASPPAAHVEYAVMAADAGKAIYCEKPLAVDLAEAEQLVDLVVSREVVNAVNFPFGAAPSVDFIAAQHASGALGDVVGVDLRLHFVPWPRVWQKEAAWLSKRAEGGFLREVGSHFVYLTEKLLGPAVLVDSSCTYPDDDRSCETFVTARLDCSGVPVSLTGTSVGVGPDIVEFVIWGSKRSIKLDNWSDVSMTFGGGWEVQEIYASDPRRENNSRFFAELAALLDGRPSSIASFADALSVQRIVEAVLA